MLTVDAQEMLVQYTPNYFDGEYAQGHFEFSSPCKPKRRILISETGYHSHFVAMEDIKAVGPETVARQIVEALLGAGSKEAQALRARGQLSLF